MTAAATSQAHKASPSGGSVPFAVAFASLVACMVAGLLLAGALVRWNASWSPLANSPLVDSAVLAGLGLGAAWLAFALVRRSRRALAVFRKVGLAAGLLNLPLLPLALAGCFDGVASYWGMGVVLTIAGAMSATPLAVWLLLRGDRVGAWFDAR
ncbi:hypothetical protein Mal64_28480 [Pseudobythopirellula maris]|uniref:Uncharacterized protein n=1 Tax=Pseudobythopirellula maris TaxID=2527991 RepID=A0A5C5ZJH1_9BACT|nr:hypothetical protein [Pseudobythopirellula maris]TWT87310.1 hypothetical protein Mal64_28480 [Pseudobythopirellula maris]